MVRRCRSFFSPAIVCGSEVGTVFVKLAWVSYILRLSLTSCNRIIVSSSSRDGRSEIAVRVTKSETILRERPAAHVAIAVLQNSCVDITMHCGVERRVRCREPFE
jgi:hypothetical protein